MGIDKYRYYIYVCVYAHIYVYIYKYIYESYRCVLRWTFDFSYIRNKLGIH